MEWCNKILDFWRGALDSNKSISGTIALWLLERRDIVLSFDDILKIITKVEPDTGMKLVHSIIRNEKISYARKSMFFQAIDLKSYSDRNMINPYMTLALYYGLLNNWNNPELSIATATMLRHGLADSVSEYRLTHDVFKELWMPPFELTGNERNQIKTKLLTAKGTTPLNQVA